VLVERCGLPRRDWELGNLLENWGLLVVVEHQDRAKSYESDGGKRPKTAFRSLSFLFLETFDELGGSMGDLIACLVAIESDLWAMSSSTEYSVPNQNVRSYDSIDRIEDRRDCGIELKIG